MFDNETKINNRKALGISAILAVFSVVLISSLQLFYFDWFPITVYILLILAYIPCGFLLKPVFRRSYLSVVSVLIMHVGVFCCCLFLSSAVDPEFGFLYFAVNTSALLLFAFSLTTDTMMDFNFICLVTVIIPALLMWLGLCIKPRLIKTRKESPCA